MDKFTLSPTKGIIAHAKVNLMLHVTGKAKGGYHHLQSVFAFTEFGDIIAIEPDSETSVRFDQGDFAPLIVPGSDSITQAIQWYFEHIDIPQRHYKICVTKNIPVAAGLGGGTSDAAAILAFLFREDFASASPDHAWEFVRKSGVLGADVPTSLAFHLRLGKVFWVDGSGREGTCLPLQTKGLSRQLVLVNPGKPLLTSEIFSALGDRFDSPLQQPDLLTQEFLLNTRNILQAPALQLMPELAKIFMIFMLDTSHTYFRLSGSGASCFAVYKDRRRADAAAEKLSTNKHGWWIQRTDLILK